ncbi:MAG TPA: serine/threonine-protein kinase [Thermoanaerobaculia bacterium]|nr:serine/threonine-protein kinase [Thermoanaerobaculia bacterium]
MQNFGKYEIVAKIGEGGFGVVYEAFDPRIARRVAIKTCPTDDQTLRQRFLHEARISGNLHHRHIIVVYDYGEEGGVPYLVQEFLTGEDLDRKINRGDEISLESRIEILIQVAEGLDFAHQQGIIHRDIKPSNIRILDDGQVKIMDFGIAKLRDSELALTLPGHTVGTPAYLAPEQIRSLELDARCDVYAFGLLAYELLTHRKAFSSKNASRVLYQILNEEPTPLRELWPECPSPVAEIVERCYRKERDERWSSLEEVAQALRGALAAQPGEGASATAIPSSPPRKPSIDRDSETMVTPGGTLGEAREAIRVANAERAKAATAMPAPAAASAGAAARARPGQSSELDDMVLEDMVLEDMVLDDMVLGGLGAGPRATPNPEEPSTKGGSAARRFAISATVVALAVVAGLIFRVVGSPMDRGAPVPPEQPAAQQEAFEAALETVPAEITEPRPAAPSAPGPAPATVEHPPAAEPSERTAVEPPAGPAGALTVRAGLGAPRLQVSVDGERVGWTPINARSLPPGEHSVAVASDDSAEPEATRSYTFDIGSEEEVVLTFDLRRTIPSVARRSYRN